MDGRASDAPVLAACAALASGRAVPDSRTHTPSTASQPTPPSVTLSTTMICPNSWRLLLSV